MNCASGLAPPVGEESGSRRWVWLPLAVILLAYLPYILHGGFTDDDWGVWGLADEHPGYLNTVRHWFPLFAIRPLAPLLLAGTGTLFGGHEWAYILLNSTVWVAALVFVARSNREWLTSSGLLAFVLLGAFPVIASTCIFSPAMQLVASAAHLLWALADACVLRAARGRWSTGWFIAGLAVLSAAFLVYEIVLPLTVFTLGRVAISGHRIDWKAAARTGLGIAGVLIAVFAYQKLLLPALGIHVSRLRPNRLVAHVGAGAFWGAAMLVQAPALVGGALLHAIKWQTLSRLDWLLVSVGALACGARVAVLNSLRTSTIEPATRRNFIAVCGVTWLSCSSLYVLSSQEASVVGYANRGLSSSWIASALLFAAILGAVKSRVIKAVGITTAVFLVGVCFIVERNQQIAASSLQRSVVRQLIERAGSEHGLAPGGVVVLGEVPVRLPSNFNDQTVFRHQWDFGNAIRLLGNGRFMDGAVLIPACSGMPLNAEIVGGEIVVDGWWRVRVSDAWLFRFGPRDAPSDGEFRRPRDEDDARRALGGRCDQGFHSVPEAAAERYAPGRLYDLLGAMLAETLGISLPPRIAPRPQ